MNLENLKYIHVYKFNTEHNNMAKIIVFIPTPAFFRSYGDCYC
jgi:hypothetical protein